MTNQPVIDGEDAIVGEDVGEVIGVGSRRSDKEFKLAVRVEVDSCHRLQSTLESELGLAVGVGARGKGNLWILFTHFPLSNQRICHPNRHATLLPSSDAIIPLYHRQLRRDVVIHSVLGSNTNPNT